MYVCVEFFFILFLLCGNRLLTIEMFQFITVNFSDCFAAPVCQSNIDYLHRMQKNAGEMNKVKAEVVASSTVSTTAHAGRNDLLGNLPNPIGNF